MTHTEAADLILRASGGEQLARATEALDRLTSEGWPMPNEKMAHYIEEIRIVLAALRTPRKLDAEVRARVQKEVDLSGEYGALVLLRLEPDPKVVEQYQYLVIQPSLQRDGGSHGMDWYCPARTWPGRFAISKRYDGPRVAC